MAACSPGRCPLKHPRLRGWESSPQGSPLPERCCFAALPLATNGQRPASLRSRKVSHSALQSVGPAELKRVDYGVRGQNSKKIPHGPRMVGAGARNVEGMVVSSGRCH
jgi:hypothetical protein